MDRKGATQRQRTELTAAALIPAALGLLGPLAAGRLNWLAPALALPLGLWLCILWRELGKTDLSHGLERAFGRGLGKLAGLLYLFWGLFLLAGSAHAYARRLQAILPGPRAEWLFLLAALAVSLWLGRGREGAFARTGRLFFLTALIALAFALALALPGLNWQNLWPAERADLAALPAGAALSLSLAGYGVYALCLPKGEGEMATWPWAVWGCAGLGWLILTVTGTFGPTLAGRLGEPFLLLLQGVEVPGAFRRGEAALLAVLALADLALLSLLARGCRSLWENAAPKSWHWVSPLLVAGAFLAAGLLPDKMGGDGPFQRWTPVGNLIFGAAVPALAVCLIKVRESKKGPSIFSGPKTIEKADVGEKTGGKKSIKENAKKC